MLEVRYFRDLEEAAELDVGRIASFTCWDATKKETEGKIWKIVIG